NANLSLIDNATQFLDALKLAISQNLEKNFTKEFEATLGELRAQQIRYVQQQTTTGLAITTLSGLVSAVGIVLGMFVLNLSASVLITLLLVLSRMGGPAMQLQLSAQQIAYALPTYEKIRELEADLSAAEALPDASANCIVMPNGPIVFHRVSYLHDSTSRA